MKGAQGQHRQSLVTLRDSGDLLTRAQIKAIRKLMPEVGGGRAMAGRMGVHWSTLYRYLAREIRVGVGAKIALCILFDESGVEAPFSLGPVEEAIRQQHKQRHKEAHHV